MIRLFVVIAVATVAAYYVGRLFAVARDRPEAYGAPRSGFFWRRVVCATAVLLVWVFFGVVYWLLELVFVSSYASLLKQ